MSAATAARRAAALVTLAALLAGCRSWQASPAPAHALAGPRARTLRITVEGLEPVVLHEPRVVADSLVGFVELAKDQPRARFAVPLADLRRVEARRFDAGLTVGAAIFAGSVAGAATLVYRLRPGA